LLIFRQLFDPQSSTYSYLLGDGAGGEAVLIDPLYEQAPRDSALVRELGLKLQCTLETHVHADHVTGASALKGRLGSKIALGAASGADGADRYLEDRERVAFGKRYLEVRSTPGHTNGCVTYVLDNESMAFTGDCLLIRGSEVDVLCFRPLLNVADHAGQYVGRDFFRGCVVDRNYLDSRLHLPHVAGDLPDELRALIDDQRRAALVGALR